MNWEDAWNQMQEQHEANLNQVYGALPEFENRQLENNLVTWKYIEAQDLQDEIGLADYVHVSTFPNNQEGVSRDYTGRVVSKHGGEIVIDASGTNYNILEIYGENIMYEKLVANFSRKRFRERELGNPMNKRIMNSTSFKNRTEFGSSRLGLKEINKLIRIVSRF